MKKNDDILSSLEVSDKIQLLIKDSDAFYEHSLRVIENTDPTHHYYTIINNSLKGYITDNRPDLNEYIKYNIFRANIETQETKEGIEAILKSCVSTVYAVCIDNKIKLSDSKNIHEVITEDLVDLVGVEMAGDIMISIDMVQ